MAKPLPLQTTTTGWKANGMPMQPCLWPVVRHKGRGFSFARLRLSFFIGRFGLPNVGFRHGKVKTNNAVTTPLCDSRKTVSKAFKLLRAEAPHTGPDLQLHSIGRGNMWLAFFTGLWKKKNGRKAIESFSPVFRLCMSACPWHAVVVMPCRQLVLWFCGVRPLCRQLLPEPAIGRQCRRQSRCVSPKKA